MIRIKMTHDQLGVLLYYLERIIAHNENKRDSLQKNSLAFHQTDAEMEILEDLKRKLHKRHIDERKRYSFGMLKMQALLIEKNLQFVSSRDVYLANEMNLISSDIYYHLINS